jgi:acyl-CoA thioesterase-1
MILKNSGLVRVLLLCCLVSLHLTAFADPKTPPVILVLGDSLSGAWGIDADQGWVALLQRQLRSRGHDYRVVNASVSGDTTRTGLSRLAPALEQHRPAIVIVALGGNDGLRGLAFSEIENSLADIIRRCTESGARVLLAGVRLPPNYGPAYNERFASLYRSLSDHYGIALVPQLLRDVAEHRELLQEDGIHPKAEAQSRIMNNVWVMLEPMLDGG